MENNGFTKSHNFDTESDQERNDGVNTTEDETNKEESINIDVEFQEDVPVSEDYGRCGLPKTRKELQRQLHGHRFQMVIIGFVALDFLIVLVQLLLDIQVIRGVHHDHHAIEILHYTSIGILGLFLIEVVIKVYAFGMDFFRHKLELFDAVVVAVSFALDVAYSGNVDAWDAVGLLVLLRLWRIVRIVNGVALSVKIEMDEKVHHLKKVVADLEKQLEYYKNKCDKEEEVSDDTSL
ncbi:voltage-gated hydrogen channel 1-like [Dendronephthya gigantea]|uniref:voltage-gated hydrogen channel 1-like n=1 Tax=Dendronephthya gigantea TaxID=151771 RepID=UPI00106AE777|nr:voltage-gated hydrogen channel 1-like [Dendronephthya gigantea]